MIHVQRTVVKLSGQKIFTKEPKTATGNRRAYISKEMCKRLKAWKQEAQAKPTCSYALHWFETPPEEQDLLEP